VFVKLLKWNNNISTHFDFHDDDNGLVSSENNSHEGDEFDFDEIKIIIIMDLDQEEDNHHFVETENIYHQFDKDTFQFYEYELF